MQTESENSILILVAEDDPDHQLLIDEALKQARIANNVEFVEDGQYALDFLRHEGNYADNVGPLPGLILLDLNMPRMGGIDTLTEIKTDPVLRSIPVVILTTSDDPSDISKTYDLGANSFITKPVSFDQLADVIHKLTNYWFQIVRLPKN